MSLDILAALNRRRLLGGAGALALLPARRSAAGTAAAGPAPDPFQSPQLQRVLHLCIDVGAGVSLGSGTRGFRRLVPLTGGTFSGPLLSGVVESGEVDWHTGRADGVTTLDARYTLRVADGTRVEVVDRGLVRPDPAVDATPIPTAPEFVPSDDRHAWLRTSAFVGALDASQFRQGYVQLRVFRVI